jgi:hypothetical protein
VPSRPPNSNSRSGKGCLVLFGLLFAGMGLAFCYLIASDFWQTGKTYRWTKTPCQILESFISIDEHSQNPFDLEIQYQYGAGGKKQVSMQTTRKTSRFSDYSKAERLLDQHPNGTHTTCYVNPADPAEAILFRDSLWEFSFVLIPLLFVAIGSGLAVLAFSKSFGQPVSSSTATSKTGKAFGILFFGVFLLAGIRFLIPVLVRPLVKFVQARHWPEAPCEIISSRVKTSSGSEGSTHRVDILFSYSAGGKVHKSNRYNFSWGSTSGYAGKKAVVKAYPPGRRTTCYINPHDPYEAVLNRNLPSDTWFAVIPLLFIAVGGIGVTSSLRRKTGAEQTPIKEIPIDTGETLLKPHGGPVLRLIGFFISAAFWNGIVFVFLMEVIHGWRGSRDHIISNLVLWAETLFLLPFLGVGLFLIGAFIYACFDLFARRPILKCSKSVIRAGDSFELRWQYPQSTVPPEISFSLVCEESRETGTGDDRKTTKADLHKSEIFRSNQRMDIRSGTATAQIPVDAQESLKEPNREITWLIRLQFKRQFWLKSKEDYPIQVVRPL